MIFDKIHTAFTYLNKDSELFKVVNVEMTDTLEEYVTLASETEQAQKDYFTAPLGNDVFQFSAFHGSHIPIFPTQIPKIKITQHHYLTGADMKKRMGKIMLPFSVQVHHSFVDGVHIGKFAENLQLYLNTLS